MRVGSSHVSWPNALERDATEDVEPRRDRVHAGSIARKRQEVGFAAAVRVRRGARKEPAEAALLGDPHDLASEAAIRPRDSRKDSRIVRLRIEHAGPLALT